MYRGRSLSHTSDTIANSIHLVKGHVVTNILDIIAQSVADTNAIINALLADQTKYKCYCKCCY